MIDDMLFDGVDDLKSPSFLDDIDFTQCTELRAKEIFVGQFQNELRYVLEAKAFFHFDGTRWVRDGGDVALGMAQTMTSLLFRHAGTITDAAQATLVGKFAVFCEARRVIQAAVALAQSDERMVARIADFDRDPFLLNTVSGTIDLRSGRLREHLREDMITKITALPYDADARCDRWERFLHEVFVAKADVVDFVHRAIGYSLTGDTREEAMFIAHGRGANGKSTLLETVKRMLGDYATTCDSDLLLARGRRDSTNDIARLAGARFVSCVEVNQGRALDESRVKAMTSTDTMTARFLFQEFFEFKPELKLWLGIESGKNDARPQLAKALAAVRRKRGILVVATLSRLGRRVSFVSTLMDEGTPFACADAPDDEPFILHVKASFAEEEARKISERTKDALAALKARGYYSNKKQRVVKLGNPQNLTSEARVKGAATNRDRAAAEHAAKLPTILALREAGKSLRAIAAEVDVSTMTVARLLQRAQ